MAKEQGSTMKQLKIGLALGSGSARGWAHIGIIRALAEHGVKPDIVCGCSIGALVGAAYASDNLNALEQWVRELTFWDVVKLLDVKMTGGLIEGANLMASFKSQIRHTNIEHLPVPYAAVATDLGSGHEVWLQQGPVLEAVRASIALPGLFSPIQVEERWLVDGGLVNPVPISVCRAMGADIIIAVNLNSDIVGRHLTPRPKSKKVDVPQQRDLFAQMMKQLNVGLRERAMAALRREPEEADESPGMLEVLASAINIMQDRITKSRMAGDPPDLLFTPQLGQLGLLEFDRADEAIAEGHACVARNLAQLQHVLKRAGLG